ncbi:hypothetical protein [Sporichthya polymorpha]|uniref:hypothetical protein n=1 Tax=Sporichthya polymorpha TaxID=35751 RepID=UPI00036F31DE|nr:hypothetical protein [Sporichthya polymorpha]
MTIQEIDPHDPAVSAAELASHLDRLVRTLNYATRPGDSRLGGVPDAYCVLGALREAMSKLPQACHQLAAAIQHSHSSGELRAVPGFPHAGDPGQAVWVAATALGEAAETCAAAGAAFGHAQSAVSGIAHERPDRTRTTRYRTRPAPSGSAQRTPGRGIER